MSKHGKELILSVIEQRADRPHSRPFCYLPSSAEPSDGFRPISYRSLRNAVDRTAYHLDAMFGHGSNTKYVWIASPTDFRYILLAFASIKTGHTAYFPPPDVQIDTLTTAMTDLGVSSLLKPSDLSMEMNESISRHTSMQVTELPRLDQLLANGPPVERYPYAKSFEQGRMDACVILHRSQFENSSRTVIIRHGWFSVCDAYHELPAIGANEHGITPLQGLRLLVACPNWQWEGLAFRMANNVFWNLIPVDPPLGQLSVEVIDACHSRPEIEATLLDTAMVQYLVRNQRFLNNLEQIKYLLLSGRPMQPQVGEAAQRRTHLISVYGNPKLCMAPFEKVTPDEWAYCRLRRETGMEFRQLTRGSSEMIVSLDSNLPWLLQLDEEPGEKLRTGSMWRKHPTRANLWQYLGDVDGA